MTKSKTRVQRIPIELDQRIKNIALRDRRTRIQVWKDVNELLKKNDNKIRRDRLF